MKFACDRNLGSLARWLRILGFDTTYPDLPDDRTLADQARNEGRTLLTRDRALAAKHPGFCYLVSAEPLDEQILEVAEALHLAPEIKPLSRCSACNGLLAPVAREAVEDSLPPRVRDYQKEYRRCESCGKVYWPGTHFERMNGRIRRLFGDSYDKIYRE